jgi:hypothetical protein
VDGGLGADAPSVGSVGPDVVDDTDADSGATGGSGTAPDRATATSDSEAVVPDADTLASGPDSSIAAPDADAAAPASDAAVPDGTPAAGAQDVSENPEADATAPVPAAPVAKQGAFSRLSPLEQADGGDRLKVEVGADGAFTDVDALTDNTLAWPASANRTLRIKADFAGTGTSKARTVTVDVPRGYRILEYSAKGGTPDTPDVTETPFSGENEGKVAESALTAIDGSSPWAAQRVTGYAARGTASDANIRVYDGRVAYSFNSSCDQVELTLKLSVQSAILARNAATTTLAPVAVSMTSGVTGLSTSLKAEVTGLTLSAFNDRTESAPPTAEDEADEDKGSVPDFSTHMYGGPPAPTSQSWTDSLTFTQSYPEGVTFKGFYENVTGVNRTTDPSGGVFASGHLTVSVDTDARTVTFAYDKVDDTYGSYVRCYWGAVVDNDTIKWGDTLKFPYTRAYTTGAMVGDPQPRTTSATVSVPVKKPVVSLTLTVPSLTRSDLNANDDWPYDYALGKFNLVNAGPTVPTDVGYGLTFSPNLAVRALLVPGASGGSSYRTISGLVAHTGGAANREISVPEPTAA